MNLSTARAAIQTLTMGTKDAFGRGAFQSYYAGHDDKHRSKSMAYSYNFSSASGNEPASFYQKDTLGKEDVFEERETKTRRPAPGQSPWSAPWVVERVKVKVGTRTVITGESDLSKDDEILLLWRALNDATSHTFYEEDGSKFKLASAIPNGYQGYSFSGGGKAFPKMAEMCGRMTLVFITTPNVQLITHYPMQAATETGWRALA